jgi:hypothetical protein
MPSYTVIRDTREKECGSYWEFSRSHPTKRPPLCLGTTTDTLKTGDYSIQNYEHLLCIERKAGFSELWNNYLNDQDRILNEFIRMAEIKYRYVLIETDLTREAFELSPSQIKTHVPGKAVIGWLMKLGSEYSVPIMFVGQCGRQVSKIIFDMVVKQERSLWVPQQK